MLGAVLGASEGDVDGVKDGITLGVCEGRPLGAIDGLRDPEGTMDGRRVGADEIVGAEVGR